MILQFSTVFNQFLGRLTIDEGRTSCDTPIRFSQKVSKTGKLLLQAIKFLVYLAQSFRAREPVDHLSKRRVKGDVCEKGTPRSHDTIPRRLPQVGGD
jgi:hypothetical protein